VSRSIPIFVEQNRTYEADACRPLVRGVEAGKVRLNALSHGHYPGRRLPRGVLPGVKSIGHWDAQHHQEWGLDWHRNEGIELTFLESGKLAFGVDGNRFSLRTGDLTITRPWQRHRVGDPNVDPGRLHWLILDVGVRRPNQPWQWPAWIILTDHDRNELTTILQHNEQPVWQGTRDLRRCFQQIGRTLETDCEKSSFSRLAVKVNELFLLVLENFRAQRIPLDETLSSNQRTVELFLADLREHHGVLAGEWTVNEMAARCGLGVTQFTAYCKELTNQTPIRYLNRCRLDAAARMLRQHPQLKVTQVALQCGFGSSQYFAKVFQQTYDCSPQSFQRSCR
jgi:AraC-like DNA-binding protein